MSPENPLKKQNTAKSPEKELATGPLRRLPALSTQTTHLFSTIDIFKVFPNILHCRTSTQFGPPTRAPPRMHPRMIRCSTFKHIPSQSRHEFIYCIFIHTYRPYISHNTRTSFSAAFTFASSTLNKANPAGVSCNTNMLVFKALIDQSKL